MEDKYGRSGNNLGLDRHFESSCDGLQSGGHRRDLINHQRGSGDIHPLRGGISACGRIDAEVGGVRSESARLAGHDFAAGAIGVGRLDIIRHNDDGGALAHLDRGRDEEVDEARPTVIAATGKDESETRATVFGWRFPTIHGRRKGVAVEVGEVDAEVLHIIA